MNSVSGRSIAVSDDAEAESSTPIEVVKPKRLPVWNSFVHNFHRMQTALPTVSVVIGRLPFALIPFAFSMFILVQALGSAWITVFAKWWGSWVAKTGTVGAVFGMYVVTVAGCNVRTALGLSVCPET